MCVRLLGIGIRGDVQLYVALGLELDRASGSREDPRYLTTFGSTRSEIVVPVMDAAGRVTGLIDVEREHENAFRDEDMQFLQSCAGEILPLFRRREG